MAWLVPSTSWLPALSVWQWCKLTFVIWFIGFLMYVWWCISRFVETAAVAGAKAAESAVTSMFLQKLAGYGLSWFADSISTIPWLSLGSTVPTPTPLPVATDSNSWWMLPAQLAIYSAAPEPSPPPKSDKSWNYAECLYYVLSAAGFFLLQT